MQYAVPPFLSVVSCLALAACSPDLAGTGVGDEAADARVAEDASAAGRDAGPRPTRPDAGSALDASPEVDGGDAATPSPGPDGGEGGTTDAAPSGEGGSPAGDASADGGPAIGADAGDECHIPGRYAVDLRLDVTWNDTTLGGFVPLLRRGTGQIRIVALVDVAGPLEAAQGTLRTCSAKLPDFATENLLVSEHYSVYFPDALWDSPSMPTYPLGLRYACARPGCDLVVEQVVATYGAIGGAGTPWPERTESAAGITLVDHDGDGFPGVSVLTRGPSEQDAFGAPYSHVPVSWTLNARATRVGVPLRVTASLSGKQVQCGLFSGTVGHATVDARAVACVAVRGSGDAEAEAECTANQVGFLDANTPAWTVVGGHFQAVLVEPGTSCVAARAMF